MRNKVIIELIKSALYALLSGLIGLMFWLVIPIFIPSWNLLDKNVQIYLCAIISSIVVLLSILIFIGKNGLTIDKLLEFVERHKNIYSLIVRIWNLVPTDSKLKILRFANPIITIGAVAIIKIIDSNSSQESILLGWHKYHERSCTPWALIGGGIKARDRDIFPGEQHSMLEKTIIREIKEETSLDVEINKLLAIDTDWQKNTMDFYFECDIKEEDKDLKNINKELDNAEIKEIKWFGINELPSNMYQPHKKFLQNVYKKIPVIPGISLTNDQTPPNWWNKIHVLERVITDVSYSKGDSEDKLGVIISEAMKIMNCEVVSLFVIKPCIEMISSDYQLIIKKNSNLILFIESHKNRGIKQYKRPKVKIPLSNMSKPKMGLTIWLATTPPFGKAKRLHGNTLILHNHMISNINQSHLSGGICHNIVAVAIVRDRYLLGLLKAENKKTNTTESEGDHIPFTIDDCYILEEVSKVAAKYIV